MQETEALITEFKERSRKRDEAELKAALEREKREKEELIEEKRRKREHMKETEKVEARALEIHTKERKLKKKKLLVKDSKLELEDQLKLVEHDIEFARRAQSSSKLIRDKLLERLTTLKRIRQERLEKEKLRVEKLKQKRAAEKERLRRLQAMCPKTKIRTY
jgi:hypothetical protein